MTSQACQLSKLTVWHPASGGGGSEACSRPPALLPSLCRGGFCFSGSRRAFWLGASRPISMEHLNEVVALSVGLMNRRVAKIGHLLAHRAWFRR